MCPICLAAAAQIVVSAVSTSGAAVVVINKFRAKRSPEKAEETTGERRMDHEQESNRESESRVAS
jgi:hypothetical protein